MATPTSLPATFVAGNVLTAAQMNDLRGAFRILQVVSTTKTDTFTASVAIGATTSITGLTASITPSSATSKVLVLAQVNASATLTYAESAVTILTRGGTPICVGDAAGSRSRGTSGSGLNALAGTWGGEAAYGIPILFLDSPATTSATTYGIDIGHTGNGTGTVRVNTPSNTGLDRSDIWRTTSTITVMEVSA